MNIFFKNNTIDKIRRELTDVEVEKIVNDLKATQLPEDIQKWVDEYDKHGVRKHFIWKWLYTINKIWYYVDIRESLNQSLTKTKFLYNMFIVLLDDVAEMKNKDDLLEQLLKIPNSKKVESNKLKLEELEYYLFARKVWNHIRSEVKKYPYYRKYMDIFKFDTDQFINAVKFANMVFKRPKLVNSKEFWMYLPHSMQILIDFDMDLMCLKRISMSELGISRKTVITLQEMGRIGNWLSTWKREVLEKDYTSAVVAYAVEDNVITYNQLIKIEPGKIIKKIEKAGIEKYLFEEWERRYNLLDDLSKSSRLINATTIKKRSAYLIRMHLASSGFK